MTDKNLNNLNIVFVCGASRSGTTLVSSLLGCHDDICAFPEFIIPITGDLDKIQGELNLLNNQKKNKLDKFYKKSGLNYDQYRNLFVKALNDFPNGINSFEDRLKFSVLFAKEISLIKKPKSKFISIKLNNSSIFKASEIYPNSKFFIIKRDLKSIINSQIKNNISSNCKQATAVIEKYYTQYSLFNNEFPQKSFEIWLENFTSGPFVILNYFFKKYLNINSLNTLNFNLSQSDIVKIGHKNSKSLSEGVKNIEPFDEKNNPELIVNKNHFLNYPIIIPNSYYETNFPQKKVFNKNDYKEIIKKFKSENDEILTLRDLNRFCNDQKNIKIKLAFIRHDVDHDLNEAIRLAEYEKLLNISSTFCILHTSPYYGDLINGKYKHNKYCIDAVKYIQSLGHEINVHNNFLVLSIKTNLNPYAVLVDELDFWSSQGVAIAGTSTHGDKLCKLNYFRNWEIFKECDLRSDGNNFLNLYNLDNNYNEHKIIPKRLISYKDFGLEYEAYDFKKDYYLTDSGGNIKEHYNVNGHSLQKEKFQNYRIHGLLTHPVWWDFK